MTMLFTQTYTHGPLRFDADGNSLTIDAEGHRLAHLTGVPDHVAAHTAAAFNRAMQAVPDRDAIGEGWTYQGKSGVWHIRCPMPRVYTAQHDEVTGDNDPAWMFAEACTLLDCMDEIDRVEDEHTCTECNSLVGEDTHDMGDGKRWLCGNCLEREIKNERGLREMAEDDKAHAMMERAAGL